MSDQTIQAIEISCLRLDNDIQQRAGGIDALVVADYAALMKDGVVFPPPVAYYDESYFWLADGFHRIAAMQQHGNVSTDVEIRNGTRDDSLIFACAANSRHGLQMTNDDKRRAVQTMLGLRPEWSNRRIAAHCGVSHTFVNQQRDIAAGNVATPETSQMREKNDVILDLDWTLADTGQRNISDLLDAELGPELSLHPIRVVANGGILETEFNQLVHSMQRFGFVVDGEGDKITLYDGMVLDGWRRYLAALKADVTPQFRNFEGDDKQAIRFVWQKFFMQTEGTTDLRRAALFILLERYCEQNGLSPMHEWL